MKRAVRVKTANNEDIFNTIVEGVYYLISFKYDYDTIMKMTLPVYMRTIVYIGKMYEIKQKSMLR